MTRVFNRKRLGEDLAALRQRLAGLTALADTGRTERVRAAKNDFGAFCRAYFPHYLDQPGCLFHDWVYATAPSWGRGSRVCVVAPRGYAKTTLLVRLYVLWRLARGDVQFPVILQETSDLAETSLQVIQVELEENARLAGDFPELCGQGPVWRKDELHTRSGIPLVARGAKKRVRGLNIRGRRPDLLVLDDPENDENVLSQTQRDKVWTWFTRAAMQAGRADGGLQVLVVGTMLHSDCLVARLAKRPDFQSRVWQALPSLPERLDLWDQWGRLHALDQRQAAAFYAARREEMDRGAVLLWPGMESLQQLMEYRLLDYRGWLSEKQNSPLDPSLLLFRPHFYTDRPAAYQCIVGAVDPARGLQHRDHTAIVILGQHADHTCDVLAAEVAWLDPMATADRVIELQRIWRCARWAVEDVAYQAVLRDLVWERGAKAGVAVPCEGVKPLYAKDIRIMSLQAPVNTGRIRFDPTHAELIKQITEYPQGTRDDGPDALELAWSLVHHTTAMAFKTAGDRAAGGLLGRFLSRGKGF